MNRAAQVVEVVGFFRNAFSVIFALALAEAFKQFVFDRAAATHPIVDWQKLIPLLSFVLLIFPFYQGTIRYFWFTYGDTNTILQQTYSAPLMFDGFMFLIEAALFFVMSRALNPAHWVTYYFAVWMLLWVDSGWGSVAAWVHGTPIQAWIWLNLAFGLIVAIMLGARSSPKLSTITATSIGAVAVLLRTAFDYYISWGFYFP